MQDQQSLYLKKLAQKNSQKSLNISFDGLKDKLNRIAENISVYENKQAISQRKRQDSYKNKKMNNLTLQMRATSKKIQKILTEGDELVQTSRRNNEYQQKISKRRKKIEILQLQRSKYEQNLIKVCQNLQRLKLEKKIIFTIRRQRQLQRQIQQLCNKRQQQQQQYKRQKNRILNKHIKISNNIQRLSLQKQRRQRMISQNNIIGIPRYKLIQKQFLLKQIKRQIQKNIQIKKYKQRRLIQYTKYVDQGLRKNINRSQSSNLKLNIIQNRQIDKNIQKNINKKQIIQKLQIDIKNKKLKINQQKKHQLQIKKDKLINPFKYHYLKLKQLTDQQIYQQFKDFKLNIDMKNLGNKYLLQSKKVMKTMPNQQNNKIDRVNIKQLSQKNEKQKYSVVNSSKCNLTETSKKSNRINSILKQSQSKSRVLSLLNHQSLISKQKIEQNMPLLSKKKPYQDLLKIEANIDVDYLNYLKTKIASMQLYLKE